MQSERSLVIPSQRECKQKGRWLSRLSVKENGKVAGYPVSVRMQTELGGAEVGVLTSGCLHGLHGLHGSRHSQAGRGNAFREE